MPVRKTILATGEYYHIYNRGVARQPTYKSKKDYDRFLISLSYYRYKNIQVKLSDALRLPIFERMNLFQDLVNTNKLVDIIAFALMPNHFHILLKQNLDNGITRFMTLITNSYARYFNTKYKRVGPVYQGTFKSVYIEDTEQLLHLSRYIHLNPLVGFILKEKEFLGYPWSSLVYYMNNKTDLITSTPILEHFKSPNHYLKFIMDHVEYGKELGKIKHLMLE